MKNQTDSKTRAVSAEIIDILMGAAFPFMLQLILSVSIISYAGYGGDDGFAVLTVIIGEILIVGSYFMFGRQNGISAYMKYVQQSKKRDLGTDDFKALNRCGEYAVWKGIAIGFITCIPYIIFQIIACAAPNDVCLFALMYVFGWAYFPLSFFGLSGWLNLIFVIALTGIHTGGYIFGAFKEKQRTAKIAEAEAMRGKKRKK